MPNIVVVGTQWGDEGKGKYVDLLSERAQVVVRFGGGHNAGHTVVVQGKKFVLHLIPSGILHRGVRCIVGNGCVVDPTAFLGELETLHQAGVEIGEQLYLSDRAHFILPYHLRLEELSEQRLGDRRIGTTWRGIGPAYEDKVARRGVRLGELRHREALREKLAFLVSEKNEWIHAQGGRDSEFTVEAIETALEPFAERALPLVTDTSLLLYRAIEAGDSVVFEGAQAALLDIDHGTYPYVTSSSATAGGACTGSGVSPKAVDFVLGVTKAYITRVGAGPLPTEMDETLGAEIRRRGEEYGASTGRPRRCGWFDALVVRYANRVNGIDALAVTKLDVLDELDEIKVCTGYRYRDDPIDVFPGELSTLQDCKAQYRTLPGWKRSTAGVTRLEDLPLAARRYLDCLEELCDTQIALVSTGPDRAATIVKHPGGRSVLDSWFDQKRPAGAVR
jgi:adenylosuccinate synthase